MIRKLDFRGFLGDLHPLGRGVAHRSPPVYKGNAGFVGNSLYNQHFPYKRDDSGEGYLSTVGPDYLEKLQNRVF